MSKTVSSFRRVWAAPLVIAIVSVVGLISALLGDGPNDWISWVGLTIPLAVLAWAWLRKRI